MSNKDEAVTDEFLDVDLMSRLPSVEVQARYLVSGFLNGLHRSPYRGSSSEFKEYRDYQQGDPLKMIDWKVYARTDKLHVRLHDDETNMNVYIVLDYSASMAYRSKGAKLTKWEYGRSLAAALMLFLNRQQDAFTLSLLGNGLEDFIRPAARQSHFYKLLAKLERAADAKECQWDAGLSEICAQIRKRSLLIMISDFYTDPVVFEPHLNRLRYMKCESIFFNVLDPAEAEFDLVGPVLLQDMEGDGRLLISPDLIREDYLKRIKAHVDSLSDLVCSYGGDYMMIKTDVPPLKALGRYLSVRSEKFK